MEAMLLRSPGGQEVMLKKQPRLLASRMGIINSEYTNASQDPSSILFEHTHRFGSSGTGAGVASASNLRSKPVQVPAAGRGSSKSGLSLHGSASSEFPASV